MMGGVLGVRNHSVFLYWSVLSDLYPCVEDFHTGILEIEHRWGLDLLTMKRMEKEDRFEGRIGIVTRMACYMRLCS